VRKRPDATVLAFDFGTRRIGVASGNTLTRVAQSLTTIDAAHGGTPFDIISALIGEWRPEQLVVGLPVHADGTPHAMTKRARGFAHELESRFALPVALVDERWTSVMAVQDLRAAGHGGRPGRARRDEAAARIILQAWLDEDHER
jgi:putative holliday junction resolvase